MKKLFTSTLLTVAAVPFLMAAPSAAKKAQNSATPAAKTQTAAVKKTHKKHVKKAQTKGTEAAAPASNTSQK